MKSNNLSALFSSSHDYWETPQALFNKINEIFSFTLDAAASDSNHKTEKYLSEKDNALFQPWAELGNIIWLNPPYDGHMRVWIEKSQQEAEKGATVVCLIAARLDTKWFKIVWDYARYVVLFYDRIQFELNGIPIKRTTFANALIVFSDVEWDLSSLNNLGKVIKLY